MAFPVYNNVTWGARHDTVAPWHDSMEAKLQAVRGRLQAVRQGYDLLFDQILVTGSNQHVVVSLRNRIPFNSADDLYSVIFDAVWSAGIHITQVTTAAPGGTSRSLVDLRPRQPAYVAPAPPPSQQVPWQSQLPSAPQGFSAPSGSATLDNSTLLLIGGGALVLVLVLVMS